MFRVGCSRSHDVSLAINSDIEFVSVLNTVPSGHGTKVSVVSCIQQGHPEMMQAGGQTHPRLAYSIMDYYLTYFDLSCTPKVKPAPSQLLGFCQCVA